MLEYIDLAGTAITAVAYFCSRTRWGRIKEWFFGGGRCIT